MKNRTISSHNIRVMFWITFFGTINFIAPVLTLFYMERGLEASHILMLQLFWSGAVLIGEVPGGVVADRFGAKISFVIGVIVKIVSIIILIFAYDPWLFFLFSALNGFSVTFFSGADEALVYESLKEDNDHHRMDRAMGKIQSASFVSMILAVLFGAYFAQDLRDEQFVMLLGLAVIFHLVELILIFFVKSPSNISLYRENPFKQVLTGVKAIRKAPTLLLLFINFTLVFIPADSVYEAFNQPIFTNAGLPVVMIGVVYSLAAICGYIASQSVGRLTSRFSRKGLMFVTGILSFIGLLLSALYGESLWLVLGAFFVLRIGQTIRRPIYSQLKNDLIPSEVRATTISLIAVLDSTFDLIVFGFLSLIAFNGLTSILLASSLIALVGTLTPIQMKKK
ncbi:MFS transporter [Aquibacillus koreensis]|uniref:MFS transporter n=1 Tax=Aquibacillus koreensis TaxID=279446 RepID=A0A9X3WJD5_9BACI|nr:MFS transporter [Aquibacillus koreensis]MCT2535717.1 MFS transporter [Aquibacillus koreensis]MDC3419998.1 MFS transporter [Aquibacillus koreensis]